MDNFQYVCLQFREKLGRRLNEEEIEFLRWVQQQHISELTLIKKGANDVK